MGKIRRNDIVKIDIGGANAPQKGFITLDDRPFRGVDIVQSYEKPLPFAGESITLIVNRVVTKVNPANNGFIKFMDECWRVLKVDGQMMISAPYACSTPFLSDPANCNSVTAQTWTYFDPLNGTGAYKIYRPKPWRLDRCFWQPNGQMEALLIKRRIDKSYNE